MWGVRTVEYCLFWGSCLALSLVLAGCQEDLQDQLDGSNGTISSPDTSTTTTLPGGPTADWDLDFKIAVPDAAADSGVAAVALRAGQDVDATDAFDNLKDSHALLTGPVQAYFHHPGEAGYTADQEKLWYDFRVHGFPKAWNFVIWATAGKDVTLSWSLPNDPEPNCATHFFVVTDRDGILPDTDLCATAGPLVYAGDGNNRNFTLTVSEK